MIETVISLNHFVTTTENIVAHHGPQALQDHILCGATAFAVRTSARLQLPSR